MAAQLLIVEDDPDQRELLADMLASEDYRLVLTGSVDEAEQALARQRVDLAILDMNLPGRSGLEAIRFIRAHADMASIPIIVLTANPQFEREADRMGTDLFLTKPVKMDTLLTLVRRCLAR